MGRRTPGSPTLARLGCFAVALTLLTGCTSSDLGWHAVDEGTARQALDDVGVVVPSEYRFGQMNKFEVGFQGRDDYYGRFDGPPELFDGHGRLQSANPRFPAFKAVPCGDRLLANSGLTYLGLMCTDAMRLLVTTDGSNPNDHDNRLVPSSETLLLATDGARTHLYVIAAGT